jgi:hypothetical protein
VNACCENPQNLEVQEDTRDRQVKKCKVCNLRQIRFKAEGAHLGVRLQPNEPTIFSNSDLTPSAPLKRA